MAASRSQGKETWEWFLNDLYQHRKRLIAESPWQRARLLEEFCRIMTRSKSTAERRLDALLRLNIVQKRDDGYCFPVRFAARAAEIYTQAVKSQLGKRSNWKQQVEWAEEWMKSAKHYLWPRQGHQRGDRPIFSWPRERLEKHPFGQRLNVVNELVAMPPDQQAWQDVQNQTSCATTRAEVLTRAQKCGAGSGAQWQVDILKLLRLSGILLKKGQQWYWQPHNVFYAFSIVAFLAEYDPLPSLHVLRNLPDSDSLLACNSWLEFKHELSTNTELQLLAMDFDDDGELAVYAGFVSVSSGINMETLFGEQ